MSMDEPTPAELVIVPDPTVKLMPFALALMAIAWGILASAIPSVLGRIVAWAAVIGSLSFVYLTTVRRLAFDDEGVDIELTRKRVRIPYEHLDSVTLRAMPLAATLHVTFVTKHPAATIRTRTGLISGEVRRVAPKILRMLAVHGVAVLVPGRPDLSTR